MFALKVHVNIVLPYVNNSGLNEGQIASKVSICWHQQCGILKARLSPHDARQKIMNGFAVCRYDANNSKKYAQ